MSYQTELNGILDRLYERRTDRLRHVLKKKQGPLLTLTKKRREDKIEEMEAIISKALAKKTAKRHFKQLVKRKKTWRTKGWGTDGKLKEFRRWVREKISRKKGKVYVFRRGKECRYVGRTRGRGTRPSHHFKRGWFNGTTSIDVYLTSQNRSVPLLECLAIHRFRPTRNKIKAAREERATKCPLCAVHKKVRTEVRKIYRFR